MSQDPCLGDVRAQTRMLRSMAPWLARSGVVTLLAIVLAWQSVETALAQNSSVIGLSNQTAAEIISGGTASLGVTLTASGPSDPDYTLIASVLNGSSATLGSPTPGSGSLAPSASVACSVPATSTNLGPNTLVFTASDPSVPNTPLSVTTTLTVMDHANASLSFGAVQTTQTINFGNVLKGATVPSQSFTIYNQAANTSAAYTASLKLTNFTAPAGDADLTTSLSAFAGLAASDGNAYSASINTSNYTTTGSKIITLSASQLADDSNLPGAGHNNNGGMTITLEGNVGNAIADNSNSPSSWGAALTALVAQNAAYTNLESTAMAAQGGSGYGQINTTATILAGTNSNSSGQTVSMQWRTETLTERSSAGLLSDVVDLSGMNPTSSGQTSPFVLQMGFNPTLLNSGSGNVGLAASEGEIGLEYLNPATNTWENAIEGNFGTNTGTFHLGAWPTGDMTLGDWGVNTSNDTVWAVVNHNSEFAGSVVAVPEPSTLVLLGVGAIGLAGCVWRRRSSGDHRIT